MDEDKLKDVETSIAEVRSLFDYDVKIAMKKMFAYFELLKEIPLEYELVTAHELFNDGTLRATLKISFPKDSMALDDVYGFIGDVHYTMANNEIYYAPKQVDDPDAATFIFEFKWYSKSYEFLLNERKILYACKW